LLVLLVALGCGDNDNSLGPLTSEDVDDDDAPAPVGSTLAPACRGHDPNVAVPDDPHDGCRFSGLASMDLTRSHFPPLAMEPPDRGGPIHSTEGASLTLRAC
jgi:hypothetical protein